MARLKGWKGSGKSRTLKSATVTYVNRGALVASSWPKKRGRPKSPVTREQNEWFRQANLLAKYADGQAQWMAIEISRGSPWYPRDILISAMKGRLFETLNLDGVEFRAVAVREDVSSDLDFLAGKVPGTIIVRGDDFWGALVPGAPDSVLTVDGPDNLPAWVPVPSVGAAYQVAKTPNAAFSGITHATKGFPFQAQSGFVIQAVGTMLNATAGHVYRGYVFEINGAITITAILGQTADIVLGSGGRASLNRPVTPQVNIEAGKLYVIAFGRRDGADNFAFPISGASNADRFNGLPNQTFKPINGLNPRVTVAKAVPAIGDLFATSTVDGFFFTADLQLP